MNFRRHALPLLFLLTLAVITLYRPAWHAANLDFVPDSTERVAATINWLQNGNYQIAADGVLHPPRYSPFFSIAFLAPALVLSNYHPGSGIYSIYITSCFGLLILYLLLAKLSNRLIGLCASLIILSLSNFQLTSRTIMSDAPAAIILAIAFILYLQITKTSDSSKKLVFMLGICSALAYLIRTINIFAILPGLLWILIAKNQTHKTFKLGLLIVPAVLVFVANYVYNLQTFGDPWRDGYNYWSAIPYDFFSLTFNLRYSLNNFSYYFSKPSIIVIFGAVLLLLILLFKLKQLQKNMDILLFLFTAVLPISTLYLLYFYPDLRFMLGIELVLALLCICLIVRIFKSANIICLSACVVAIICSFYNYASYQYFSIYQLSRSISIAEYMQANSVLISPINEIFLNLHFKKYNVEVLPLDRDNEYASKMIAPQRLTEFSGSDPLLHRPANAEVLGLKEAIPLVATDKIDYLLKVANSGRGIYLDLNRRSPQRIAEHLAIFSKYFTTLEITKNFYQLSIVK